MASYKEIFGTNIEVLASDPANPVTGQVWYNSTENVVKGEVFQAASWASGGALGTGRERGAGNGTQTSALAYGGLTAPGAPNKTGQTESYNGSAWTEVNDLNTARYDIAGAGTDSTQALCIGGQTGLGRQVITESWDGSSWTEVGDLNISKGAGQATGTYTSAIATGGDTAPTADAESWNGTSWTEISDMNRSRVTGGMSGTSNTTALAFGGLDPSPPAVIHGETELWNGTSWTELNDLNQARDSLSGSGTHTSAIAAGGDNPFSTALSVTESWNGTSWTEVADLSTARSRPLNNAGLDATQALVSGGAPHITTTEEFTGATTVPATFTDS